MTLISTKTSVPKHLHKTNFLTIASDFSMKQCLTCKFVKQKCKTTQKNSRTFDDMKMGTKLWNNLFFTMCLSHCSHLFLTSFLHSHVPHCFPQWFFFFHFFFSSDITPFFLTMHMSLFFLNEFFLDSHFSHCFPQWLFFFPFFFFFSDINLNCSTTSLISFCDHFSFLSFSIRHSSIPNLMHFASTQ